MKACFTKHTLEFKRPAGTSRGVLHLKETWLLLLREGERIGLGECNMFRGLSHDDRPDYEEELRRVCHRIGQGGLPTEAELTDWPSIRFGLEQAQLSLEADRPFEPIPSDFTRGKGSIPINGLVWMGDEHFMREQVHQKLEEGFDCIKMKIGALDFPTELGILKDIRSDWGPEKITLRVDANGAFTPIEARRVLEELEPLSIHSIEQPIKAGQWDQMAELCQWSPVPIALDEELIGIHEASEKSRLLEHIRPPYIILKPSLLGGFAASEEWISRVLELGGDYWVTSALESNLGLNAIAQWTYTRMPRLPQGLGTGGLFINNFPCPLRVAKGTLKIGVEENWDLHYFSQLCT